MRRKNALIPVGLMVAAIVAVANACDGSDHDDPGDGTNAHAGCASGTCDVRVHSGSTLHIGGQDFTVQLVDDDSVKLSTHGVSFTLRKGLNLGIGRFHLRLEKVEGGSAEISVDD